MTIVVDDSGHEQVVTSASEVRQNLEEAAELDESRGLSRKGSFLSNMMRQFI